MLEAQRNRKSEQLSKDQLALFETLVGSRRSGGVRVQRRQPDPLKTSRNPKPEEPEQEQNKKRSGRQPLAQNLIRERIVHDLAEPEKHCGCCGKDLRLLGEETSERYEFIPAVDEGDRGRAVEVRLRLHGEDGR